MEKAGEYRMPAVAVTDHGNMFGAMEFYLSASPPASSRSSAARSTWLPVRAFAREARSIGDAFHYHLILLCENLTGYRNLCKLVSAGYKEGFYRRPRIDKEVLAEHSEGLIVLSACLKGEVATLCGRNRMEEARAAARGIRQRFSPDATTSRLQENTIPEQTWPTRRLLRRSPASWTCRWWRPTTATT